MKLWHIVFALFTVIFLNEAQGQVMDNCRPITTTDPKESIWIAAKNIIETGEYCLTHDIKAPRVSDFSSGGERSYAGYMLTTSASNVVFDLRGYSMKVDASGMGGVLSVQRWNTPLSTHITIRNGTISTRGQSAILFADMFGSEMSSLLSDFKASYKRAGAAESEFQKLLKSLPKSASDYPETDYIVENMKVEARVGRAVIGMQGAANIIRNSTIIAEDEHAAIYLFGPNSIIENNIIIYKGHGGAAPSTAPIKLHQADGTIIRNNDIIIESSGDDAPKAAISLIDSKGVIAENNRIYGIKALAYAWDDKSSLIDRNNDSRSMLRRPWPSAEPGVRQ